eukprot:SAG11_NODE_3239_length_2589_cov_5.581124_2_plen_124_part_00
MPYIFSQSVAPYTYSSWIQLTYSTSTIAAKMTITADTPIASSRRAGHGFDVQVQRNLCHHCCCAQHSSHTWCRWFTIVVNGVNIGTQHRVDDALAAVLASAAIVDVVANAVASWVGPTVNILK